MNYFVYLLKVFLILHVKNSRKQRLPAECSAKSQYMKYGLWLPRAGSIIITQRLFCYQTITLWRVFLWPLKAPQSYQASPM